MAPVRAAAALASIPACPPPTTTTSKWRERRRTLHPKPFAIRRHSRAAATNKSPVAIEVADCRGLSHLPFCFLLQLILLSFLFILLSIHIFVCNSHSKSMAVMTKTAFKMAAEGSFCAFLRLIMHRSVGRCLAHPAAACLTAILRAKTSPMQEPALPSSDETPKRPFCSEDAQSPPIAAENTPPSTCQMRLDILPTFLSAKDLKKKILAAFVAQYLAASLPNKPVDFTVKKAPNWNFAYVTFAVSEDFEFFVRFLRNEQFCLKGVAVKGTPCSALPARASPSAKRAAIEDGECLSKETVSHQVTPLFAMPYAQQLTLKKAQLEASIPPSIAACMRDTLPSPAPNNYRNKCEFSIGSNVDGQPAVGFTMGLFRDGVVAVAAADECVHVAASHKQIARHLLALICAPADDGTLFPVYDRRTHCGVWRLLVVRSNSRGEHMIGVQINGSSLSAAQLAALKERLVAWFVQPTANQQSLPPIVSLQLQTSSSKNHGVDASLPFEVLHGADHIYEYLQGDDGAKEPLRFRIHINSFFQVNTPATELLYAVIRDRALDGLMPQNCVLLDLCCGTGTIGISLAAAFKRVIGVEMVKEAVDDAKHNAEINGVTNINFVCAKLEACIDSVISSIDAADSIVVVLDPPRSGAHASVIRCLKKKSLAGRISRIVYVSCSAEQASSNFSALMKKGDAKQNNLSATLHYTPTSATPVDLFPHTKHCELVVAFDACNV